MGNAQDLEPNVNYPLVGYGVLFKNHISFVEFIDGDKLTVSETNWSKDKNGRGLFTIREVSLNDRSIRGYLRP